MLNYILLHRVTQGDTRVLLVGREDRKHCQFSRSQLALPQSQVCSKSLNSYLPAPKCCSPFLLFAVFLSFLFSVLSLLKMSTRYANLASQYFQYLKMLGKVRVFIFEVGHDLFSQIPHSLQNSSPGATSPHSERAGARPLLPFPCIAL